MRSACPGIVTHVTDRPSGCHGDLIHLACLDKDKLNKNTPLGKISKSCEINRAHRGLKNASGGYDFPASFEDWSSCQAQTPNTQLKNALQLALSLCPGFPLSTGPGPLCSDQSGSSEPSHVLPCPLFETTTFPPRNWSHCR